jgi:hypothetical protein
VTDKTTRPIFVVKLQAPPNVNEIRAVRAALKVLLRRFGLRCVGIAEHTDEIRELRKGATRENYFS